MPGDVLLLGPNQETEAIDLGQNLFRKQVLPKGTINYNGRPLTFDDAYLGDLVNAFNEKAFDQNAFQLSDGKLEHTTDPERFRGEVLGYEVTPTGLDAIMHLTDSGAELVRANPKLGVSPRIVEGLHHADGRSFPRAIHHVAGTLDPRNTGMAEWEELESVSLSGESIGSIVDLTAAPLEEPEEPPVDPVVEEPGTIEPDDDAAAEAAVAEMFETVTTDPEVEMPVEDEGTPPVIPENVTQHVRDLVRAENEQRDSRIMELEVDLARSRYESEAHALIEAGTPPHLVELARPLLELPAQPIIDLGRDDEEGNRAIVDVGGIVRTILRESGKYFELGRELGSTFRPQEGQSQDEAVLGELRKMGGK